MKTLFLKIIFLFSILTVFSQEKTVKYPYYILPGQKTVVAPQNDTLWVITHSQLKKTIITAKKNKILVKEVENLKKQKKVLEQKTMEQDSLKNIYKKDRDFYVKKYEEAEADLTQCFNKGKKQKTLLKIAVGSGIALSVASFFLGAYLFH